jgi:hypothetical protein
MSSVAAKPAVHPPQTKAAAAVDARKNFAKLSD